MILNNKHFCVQFYVYLGKSLPETYDMLKIVFVQEVRDKLTKYYSQFKIFKMQKLMKMSVKINRIVRNYRRLFKNCVR